MRTVHIEAKRRGAPQTLDALRAAVAGAAGLELTAADAATRSGVPLDEAEPGLLQLAREWPCRLRVTDSGALLFRFDPVPPRPGWPARVLTATATALRRLRDPGMAFLTLLVTPPLLFGTAGNVFANFGGDYPGSGVATVAFGLPWLAIALVAGLAGVLTLVTFHVLLLGGAGMLAAAAALLGSLVLEPSRLLAPSALGYLALVAGLGSLGWFFTRLTWRQYREACLPGQESAVRDLWRLVGRLLLGPPRANPDPFQDERCLMALIRARGGVVTQVDLMALFGWTPDEADREVTRVLVDHGGDLTVSDDGAVLYVFDDLLRSAQQAPAPAPPWIYEAPPRPPALVGVHGRVLAFLGVIAGSSVTGLAAMPQLAVLPFPVDFARLDGGRALGLPLTLLQGFGAWPLLAVASAIALRLPAWAVRRRRFALWARRLPVIRAAHGATEDGESLDGIDAELLVRFGGERVSVDLVGSAAPRVVFPEHARAQAAAEALRAARAMVRPDHEAVTFDTEDEATWGRGEPASQSAS